MKRYTIIHHTTYSFSGFVQLQPHTLRLRPREGHELRIESSKLEISPNATLRWHRDVEGNSVATARFVDQANTLSIKSEIVIQQYDLLPLDFLVAEYAVNYPFDYLEEDQILLSPYLDKRETRESPDFEGWISKIWQNGEHIQSIELLQRLNRTVHDSIQYRSREEEGVQGAEQTLACNTGSCRDLANLFMVVARRFGFAARFVSGYLHTNSPSFLSGSTHAWAEVFIPGAGWKGFDPTIGDIAGPQHIAVAVARLPSSVPPVSGAFVGLPGATMRVSVWVNELI